MGDIRSQGQNTTHVLAFTRIESRDNFRRKEHKSRNKDYMGCVGWRIAGSRCCWLWPVRGRPPIRHRHQTKRATLTIMPFLTKIPAFLSLFIWLMSRP